MEKYQQYSILYVDDEQQSLKYFSKFFSRFFDVRTAESAAEGWSMLDDPDSRIALLLTDQKMPGETGVELLEKVRRKYPAVIRILVTAFADLDSAIAAVNSGAIYKYISKPWDINDLKITIMRALDFYAILQERDQLLVEKISTVQRLFIANNRKDAVILAAGLNGVFRNAIHAVSNYVDHTPEQAHAVAGVNILTESNFEELKIQYIFESIQKLLKQLSAELEEIEVNSTFFSSIAPESGPSEPAPDPFILEFRGNPGKIQCVPKLLQEMARLLAENVFRLTDIGHPITITVDQLTNPDGDGVLELIFDDSGGAWTPETLGQLYSPLQVVEGHSYHPGLDLLLCYFIVGHHGGTISVTGEEGRKVVITLPAKQLRHGEPDLNSDSETLARLLSECLQSSFD